MVEEPQVTQYIPLKPNDKSLQKQRRSKEELLIEEYGTHSKRVRVQMSWRTQRYHTKGKQDLEKAFKAPKTGIKT